MSRVGVLIMGPAGAGKSTFCNALIRRITAMGRRAHIVNLDPAANAQEYEFTVDIKDLISLEDTMDELDLGPNGGLMYCFDFLLSNLDWLDEEIGDYDEEYLLFDCPGQIELYSHYPVMPQIIRHLKENLQFNLCACYLLEASFVLDKSKFFSGVLSAMSAMLLLETPHLNILSKIDLLKDIPKRELKRFMNPDPLLMAETTEETMDELNPRYASLSRAVARLTEEFGMVQFLPLHAKNDDSVEAILSYIDDVTQWQESQEPKEPVDPEADFDIDEADF